MRLGGFPGWQWLAHDESVAKAGFHGKRLAAFGRGDEDHPGCGDGGVAVGAPVAAGMGLPQRGQRADAMRGLQRALELEPTSREAGLVPRARVRDKFAGDLADTYVMREVDSYWFRINRIRVYQDDSWMRLITVMTQAGLDPVDEDNGFFSRQEHLIFWLVATGLLASLRLIAITPVVLAIVRR